MGVINPHQYPIWVDLFHDDIVDHTYEDEWGIHDIFIISSVYYNNVSPFDYRVTIVDLNGKTFQTDVLSGAEGTINLPTPLRFDSYPLASCGLTLIR